jgi:hypothetical protein
MTAPIGMTPPESPSLVTVLAADTTNGPSGQIELLQFTPPHNGQNS